MPEKHESSPADKADWLKIEIYSPLEMIDALNNFVAEIGAEGAFQEYAAQPQNGLPESATPEILKVFLPCDIRLKQRIASLQTYMDSLAEIFPELEKPTMKTATIHDPDWGEAWKKYFKPLRVTKTIVIKPTWERYLPAGKDVVIDIDPGMAFGTGQHPSTRMCLEALENILLHERAIDKWRVLDVGTGTGILGIAAAKLKEANVLCVDTDKKAVEIAIENVMINNMERHVEVRHCEIAALDETFELIVANITAKTLIKLRPHLQRLLKQNGYLVISGIIEQDKKDIEEHFPTAAFPVHQLLTEKEWLCFALRKGNPHA
ncbi:MAG: 50S ribosomal protein L11 methyltransferase [Syntrophobacterales bacterium]|nr:50S ribosomal protein L11 methyltransferase [Syntrophobacterales bacterium]